MQKFANIAVGENVTVAVSRLVHYMSARKSTLNVLMAGDDGIEDGGIFEPPWGDNLPQPKTVNKHSQPTI